MKLDKINRQSIGLSGLTSILRNYSDIPQELHIQGTLPKERPLVVAIVGSRRPTAYGKHVTHQLAYELAKRGVVIVSGLAYGVDAIAHEAALEAGGVTIAVMANGLHRVYPVAHTGLAKRIVAQGGALISEQPPGVDAHKYHFLARNRIVSGLADALIVTEPPIVAAHTQPLRTPSRKTKKCSRYPDQSRAYFRLDQIRFYSKAPASA